MGPTTRRLLNLGLLLTLAALLALALALFWPATNQASQKGEDGQQAQAASRPAATPGRDPFAPPGGQGWQTPREELLEVLGVVVGPGETLALVRFGAAVKRLHPGESVGRFRLQEVLPDRLVFQETRAGGQREVLIKRNLDAPEPQRKK